MLKFTLGIIALISTFAFATQAQAQSQSVDWKKYDYIDPNHVVPTQPLKRAIEYFDRYQNQIPNRDYLTVVDFTPKSTQPRFYLIDMHSGNVDVFLVAHGEGSDPKRTGYTTKFSNIENSYMSSLGFYITTKEVFNGKNGISLRLKGIEKTNNLALQRAILVHGADYVKDGLDPLGRSQGCFVLDHKYNAEVINKIANGSIIYAWIDPKILGPVVNDVQTIIR